MSKLISFQRLGENRGAPRLWIEGGRLERLGFRPGMPVDCVAGPGGGLTLLASALGANRVSQRRAGDSRAAPVFGVALLFLVHLAE